MLLKELVTGSTLYALIKGEEFVCTDGTVNNIGAPRTELPKYDASQPFAQPASAMKTVVDLTYTINGKTYTDTVDANMSMFPTDKTGAITLVATSIEPILRELRATRKQKEDYLKETETGIPKAKERLKECDALIAKLDTSFAEKQALNERINNLEAQNAETNKLLRELINKLGK